MGILAKECIACNSQRFENEKSFSFDQVKIAYLNQGGRKVYSELVWDADQKASGFSDDFSAEIYGEIESACLDISEDSKKLVNWKLFALEGDSRIRLHDIRFEVPADENPETTIEAHTE